MAVPGHVGNIKVWSIYFPNLGRIFMLYLHVFSHKDHAVDAENMLNIMVFSHYFKKPTAYVTESQYGISTCRDLQNPNRRHHAQNGKEHDEEEKDSQHPVQPFLLGVVDPVVEQACE